MVTAGASLNVLKAIYQFTLGLILCINAEPVFLQIKRHPVVEPLSKEEKYLALSAFVKGLGWLQRLVFKKVYQLE